MNETIIAWTDTTWNAIFGCSKVSEGCRHCYAERIALKFGHSKKEWTAANAPENVQLKPNKLRDPYKLKQPTRIFVNSMSDLFHELVPDGYIDQIFAVMVELPQHTFQALTKRPERMARYVAGWLRRTGRDIVPAHIWLGTSMEDQKNFDKRLPHLLATKATIRFISAEPLIGEIDMSGRLDGVNWIIVGGESGPGFRPMPHEWPRAIRDACRAQGVAFFFKQSAAFVTERGTYLTEEDGSKMEYKEYPTIPAEGVLTQSAFV